MVIVYLVGGIPTPPKNMKVSWDDFSQYMEKKGHVPNHQPDTQSSGLLHKLLRFFSWLFYAPKGSPHGVTHPHGVGKRRRKDQRVCPGWLDAGSEDPREIGFPWEYPQMDG